MRLTTRPPAAGTDIALLQYSSAGALLWTAQTGTSGADAGQGVALSPDGARVYVVGYASGSLNGQPYKGLTPNYYCDYSNYCCCFATICLRR